MYIFNLGLFAELPKIFGKTANDLAEIVGILPYKMYRWLNGANMNVADLVDALNKLHLSMADFLVTDEYVIPSGIRKNDLVIPDDIWKPIEWHPENLMKAYGKGTPFGGCAQFLRAAKVDRRSFNNWVVDPSYMSVKTLLKILNNAHLDAKLLIADSNKNIALPVWEDRSLAEQVNEQLSEAAHIKNLLKEKEDRIARLNLKVERLENENRTLKEAGKRTENVMSGMVAEPVVRYAAPMSKGYVFHKELWERLPGIFGMYDRDFCRLVGISQATYSIDGIIYMEHIVSACNSLHMSIGHFFLPKDEIVTIHDRGYYEIPLRQFKPVELHLERLEFLFGRYSVLDYSVDDLKRSTDVKSSAFHAIKAGGGMKVRNVNTVADICTQFNIHPMVFFEDRNERFRPAYSVSRNQLLLENCIKLMKEVKELREKVRVEKKKE